MKSAPLALLIVPLLFVNVMFQGCIAESTTVVGTPVWSATLPGHGVEYSRTTNVFPFYSKNVTAYADRVEESGTVLLFFSWSNVEPRVAAEEAPVEEAPVEAEEPADVDVIEPDEAVEIEIEEAAADVEEPAEVIEPEAEVEIEIEIRAAPADVEIEEAPAETEEEAADVEETPVEPEADEPAEE